MFQAGIHTSQGCASSSFFSVEQSVALSAIGDLIRMLNPVVHRDIPPPDISCPPLAQSGDIREWERKVVAGTQGAGHSSRSSRDRSVMIVEGCAYILLTSGDGGSFSLDVCPRLSMKGRSVDINYHMPGDFAPVDYALLCSLEATCPSLSSWPGWQRGPQFWKQQ